MHVVCKFHCNLPCFIKDLFGILFLCWTANGRDMNTSEERNWWGTKWNRGHKLLTELMVSLQTFCPLKCCRFKFFSWKSRYFKVMIAWNERSGSPLTHKKTSSVNHESYTSHTSYDTNPSGYLKLSLSYGRDVWQTKGAKTCFAVPF